MRTFTFLAVFLVIPTLGLSATLYVPGSYSTIQEAIDSAQNDDRIIVSAGTYVENINFKGLSIRVQGATGPDFTFIDGNQTGSVVTFASGEGAGSRLEGFSIFNGSGTYLEAPFNDFCGGGIFCDGASPTLENNIVYSCTSSYGAGIFCTDSADAEILKNTVFGNSATVGAGIFCRDSSPLIFDNRIAGNPAGYGGGGIACWLTSAPLIVNNQIFDNTSGSGGGAGIRVYNNSSPQIINNTIHGNVSTSGSGGGLLIKNSFVSVINTIFWDNDSADLSEIWVGHSSTPSVLDIDFSDVQDGLAAVIVIAPSTVNWGAGMIDADPILHDPAIGDCHLEQDPPQPGIFNPCVDTGDPTSMLLDGSTRTDDVLDSGIVDMGYHYMAPVPDEPEIYEVMPETGHVAGGTAVTISGDYFTDTADTTVTFDGISAGDLVVVDVNTITCTTPAHVSGTVDVTVTNSNGFDTLVSGFTYNFEPIVSSVDPDNGPVAGGTAVTISGDYFTDTADTTVTFDGISAGDLVVVDVNTITCTTPAHVSGAVDVTVTNSNGSGTLVSGFNYYPIVIHVPGDYTSIQEAIDASHNGGTVLVEPGVYVEAINFYGKAIVLRSDIDGVSATEDIAPEATWIDGNFLGSVITFDNGEGTETQIRGFSIYNGLGDTYSGGGVTCLGASPTISDNIIISNDSLDSGGGICVRESASPVITNNLIYENSADFYGAGIAIYDSSPTITNNTLVQNSVTGIGGYGGGISIWGGDPVITNTIVWANSATNDSGIYLNSGVPQITYCTVEGGWTGVGNIDRDPLFLNAARSNFRLSWQSACVDAGINSAPSLPALDLDGNTRIHDGNGDLQPVADLGCFELIPFSVPSEYASIQSALNASSRGNMVVVKAGVYYETLDFMGKTVSLVSEEGPDVTTIDGNQAGCAVYFSGGEEPHTHLEGFTITNGLGGGSDGGAVTCTAASPTITGNKMDSNQATSSGGGLFADHDSSPFIEKNTFIGNSTIAADGGAVACGGDSILVNNIILGNSASLYGGGLYFHSGSPRATNNTIVGNTAQYGGGIGCADSAPFISNSILWNNTAPSGKEIAIGTAAEPSTLTVSYSNVEGGQSSVLVDANCSLNWNAGMIDSDPLFVGLTDFHLTWNSPCRNSGDNTAADISALDFEGDPRITLTTIDMGADEYYYHLYYTGRAIPGQVVRVRIVGYQGLPVELYQGSDLQDPPSLTEHGQIFIEFPPLNSWSLGKIPANGVLSFPVTIPSTWNPGEKYFYQALIGRWGWNLTRISNLMTLRVQ